MRRTILAGLILVAATVLAVIVGEGLDLNVESVALLGIAAGAIVGLVPDQNLSRRLAAFLLGFVACFVGYLFRAAILPDTSNGRAFAAGTIVLLCVGVVVISVGRLPLWGALLGAASLAGAYEYTYAQAPTRVLDTSVSSATTLLLCAGVGFLVTALMPPAGDATTEGSRDTDDQTPINDMMETSK